MPSCSWANQINNRNFLSGIGFKFNLAKYPKVDFFCNTAKIPEITLATATQPSYLKDLDIPGEKLTYGDLTIQFLVDENMENYRTVYDWLVGLGYPDNFDQRANLIASSHIYSDASLLITTNQYKPNIDISFIDIYPTSLSSVEFNIEQGDVEYLNADVTFSYRRYKLTAVT